jgi:hypothetical protein
VRNPWDIRVEMRRFPRGLIQGQNHWILDETRREIHSAAKRSTHHSCPVLAHLSPVRHSRAVRGSTIMIAFCIIAFMSDYTIRDVDNDLWRKVKAKAATDGKPIRTVILELLTTYTQKKEAKS